MSLALHEWYRASAPSRRVSMSSRRLTYLGFGVAAGLFITGVFAEYSARQDAWNAALTHSSNLLQALQQSVGASISVIDLSLQNAQQAVADGDLRQTDLTLCRRALFGQVSASAGFKAIAVVSQTGAVIESCGDLPRGLDWSNRDEFSVQKANKDIGLYVGRASRSWFSEDEPSLFLSRRISGPGGAFDGVVSAAIRLDYFEHLFKSMDVGPDGGIVLMRSDGHILWRYPYRDGDLDRDLSQTETFRRLSASTDGHLDATSSIDGKVRLYRFGQVGDLPMFLTVNLAEDDIYARWRQKALIIGPVLIAMCTAIVVLTLLFRLEMGRRAAAEQALTETAQKLAGLASSDPLTALANRRTLDETADREWRRAVRTEDHLAVLMIDVDHFKAFNDTYGHPDGDRVLQRICLVIGDSLRRPTDLAARYGGEEFAVLLPGSDEAGAQIVAERIRSAVEDLALGHTGSPLGRVTVSIGFASMVAQPDVAMSKVMAWADRELYRSKREGRNRVCGGGTNSREPRRERADAAAIIG